MATINGTTSNDTLSGTAGDDTINGFEGNDLFLAGSTGGNDVINGGGGRDSIEFKTRATSAIVVDFVAGTITGGSTGTISFTSIERVVTGDFNDQITGNAAGQTLAGQGGSDTIWGAGGVDTLWGGTGADSFVFRETGTSNADRISDFASGSDKIVLDASKMTALGANGNFAAGDARFVANLSGAAQDAGDRIIYETDTRQVWYDPDGTGVAARQLIATLQVGATLVSTDIVVEGGSAPSGGQTINGTAGNDSLAGGAGNDTINAFGGDDTINGGAGVDSMIGGEGADLYFVDNSADVIVEDQLGGMDLVNASASYALPAWVNNLTLTGTAAINGTGNDIINVLVGNSAGNSLSGGGQDDTLDGRQGNDTLTGGAGVDHFMFTVAPGAANADNITDFLWNTDKLHLDASVMPALGTTGDFQHADHRFYAAAGATGGHDSNDRVIFNTTTRQVFYDADGNGGGAAQLIATLAAGASLTATDIVVENGAAPGGTINGTEGDDTITGSSGDDTINGLGGTDSLQGNAGNDSLNGGAGRDDLHGGEGNDTLVAGDNDASGQSQLMAGGPGDDVMIGSATGDVYIVDSLGDRLTDTGGRDAINVSISYTAPDWAEQVALMGSEPLSLTGHSFASSLYGNDGANLVQGLGGNDWLGGGLGNDTLIGGDGADTLHGLSGKDRLEGGSGTDDYSFWLTAPGAADADTIVGFATGTDFITLDGSVHANLGTGGRFQAGDQRFLAAPGASSGEDTNDRVVYNTTTGELWYDADGSFAGAAQLIATLQGAPTLAATDILVLNGTTPGSPINGTNGNDSILGTAGNDSINGLDGFDTINGLGGNDTIDGGRGSDRLNGGDGADLLIGGLDGNWFEFSSAPGNANADTVADFGRFLDTIRLDATLMPALGASGRFGGGDARYAENSTGTAQDPFDRVIYNTSSGELWYDSDGSGANGRLLIATLQGAPDIASTNIEVVNGTSSGNVVSGTSGDDTIDGTAGGDTIDGLGGNDLIRGYDGADSLRGSDGNDTLVAAELQFLQSRPDEAFEMSEDGVADTLDGGFGDDEYHVDNRTEADVILPDPGGIDHVFAWGWEWTLGPGLENLTIAFMFGGNGTGNELDNHIVGASEGGTLLGLGGNDTLDLSQHSEDVYTVRGGDGNDVLLGGSAGGGRDVLFGDAGNDLIVAGGGVSSMTGGTGADVFYFDTPPDRVDPEHSGPDDLESISDFVSATDTVRLDGEVMAALGPSGRFSAADARYAENSTGTAQDSSDRVIYNTSTGDLWYDPDGSGAGERLYIGLLQGAPGLAATDIEVVNGTAPQPGSTINGTSGPDTLTGTAGDDTINGLDGNDLFLAGSTGGNDVINGGAGRDSIEFRERATSAITVDFVSGTIAGGSSGTISFTSIERVLTGNFNDTLTGNAAAQTLTGQGGADTIAGAGGIDTLWGATGADAFVFREMGTANADRISDFTTGSDKIHLDDAAFTMIGGAGNFAAGDGRFASNTSGAAGDAGDRVIFNTSTGQLYYDADGSGGGAPQLIATVQTGATVAATDIVVI